MKKDCRRDQDASNLRIFVDKNLSQPEFVTPVTLCVDHKAILVLDDDDCFRELVETLLVPHGYSIWHARNAEQATAYVTMCQPVLAIVDYRLPGMDGVSWISHIRTAGAKFPIVFVSSRWCDESTFNWLRNILNVSLILQKPIIPELFLHSIDSVLPLAVDFDTETGTDTIDSDPIENLLSKDPLEMLNEIEKMLLDPSLDQSKICELHELKNSVQSQFVVMTGRKQFIRDVSSLMARLVETIVDARAKNFNCKCVQKAVELTQQFSKRAEHFGFAELSALLTKLRNFLSCLDSCESTEVDIFWSEAEDLIVQGCNAAEILLEELSEPAFVDGAFSMLVASAHEGDAEGMRTLVGHHRISEVHSRQAARARCTSEKFDAAVVDLTLDSPVEMFQLCRELRSVPGNQNIPLCLILKDDQSISLSELTYVGCSAILKNSATAESRKFALERLKAESFSNKPRVLLVDDDPMLCKYIEEILRQHGCVVRFLHSPIRISETLDDFKPHLVILDVVMPGLCGYDVCRAIRENEAWKHLPIIFLTAKADQSSQSAAFKAGADDFLSKPVNPQRLLSRVDVFIGKSIFDPPEDIDEESGVLTKEAFLHKAERLLQNCELNKQPCSAALLSFDDVNSKTVSDEAFTEERIVTALGRILTARFRSCDVRGRWDRNRFVLLMPGLNRTECQDVLNCLLEEWAQHSSIYADTTYLAELHMTFAQSDVDGSTVEGLVRCCESRVGLL